MSLPIEIKREIEKISATICDKLCRFRPTCNGNFKNDKEHGKCPMDKEEYDGKKELSSNK